MPENSHLYLITDLEGFFWWSFYTRKWYDALTGTECFYSGVENSMAG